MMLLLLNAGIVEIKGEINMLPVVIGIVMVLVGLLGLAVLHMTPQDQIFNTAAGTEQEGHVPPPLLWISDEGEAVKEHEAGWDCYDSFNSEAGEARECVQAPEIPRGYDCLSGRASADTGLDG